MIDDNSLYINFVLHAIYGKLAEADQLMRVCGDGIRRVAAGFRARFQIEPEPLYRGVLLDPMQLKFNARHNAYATFASWSEDLDVAAWFASRDSIISEPMREDNPAVRGFVYTLEPSTPRVVLFHHAWIRKLMGYEAFSALACLHPLMDTEGQRQILWSLNTQREVITEPLALPDARPIEAIACSSVVELDRKFSPPWCRPIED